MHETTRERIQSEEHSRRPDGLPYLKTGRVGTNRENLREAQGGGNPEKGFIPEVKRTSERKGCQPPNVERLRKMTGTQSAGGGCDQKVL